MSNLFNPFILSFDESDDLLEIIVIKLMTVRTLFLTLFLAVALSQNCDKTQVVFGDTCFN